MPAFQSAGVRSVAICFKNAYANPANEETAAELVRQCWPETFITRSTALTNRARLYDRVSSAVVNSFVGPQTSGYIQALQQRLEAFGFRRPATNYGRQRWRDEPRGGRALPGEAHPVRAGGPVAGQLTLDAADRPPDGIVVDMGGTSSTSP